MKLHRLVSLLALCTSVTAPLGAQAVTLPQESPHASVAQTIGITEVSVTYHRPSVNGREVWGKLVPFGFNGLGFGTSPAAPWRAGANENTVISFAHDVMVAGQPLKAGRYGLHMAIAPSGVVTVIFSRDTAVWGSFFYDPAADALRVDVRWEDAPFREQLAYEFTDITAKSAVLALHWEKKRIPIPLAVDTHRVVIAQLKDELRNSKGFSFQAWVDASNYLLTQNIELPLALSWAESAVGAPFVGQKNFATLSNQAKILEKLGRSADATSVMNEALKFGSAVQIHQYGRQLITAGQGARALEVFQLNVRLHPDVWPVNYGLARGYSAVADYPAALTALLKAQQQIPAGDTVNATAIKANLEKLKRGENIN